MSNHRRTHSDIGKQIQTPEIKPGSVTYSQLGCDQNIASASRSYDYRRSVSSNEYTGHLHVPPAIEVPRIEQEEAAVYNDDTTVLIQDGGRRDVYFRRSESVRSDPNAPPRLMLISNKIKNSLVMQSAVLPNVKCLQYKYETATLDNILGLISQALDGRKVESVGLILQSTNSSINISGKDDKCVTKENILEYAPVRSFFSTLAKSYIDESWVNARIDFLACNAAQNGDGSLIAREIESITGLPVAVSRDIVGSDVPMQRVGNDTDAKLVAVGELYFRMDRLRSLSGHTQSLAGFEKIRTVGKGAYGTAVLYRKKDDDSLVILKEINLHDLNASERQLAMNEVRVLAMLDHPNIISYYDSFEEDGLVMIEMEYADGGTLSQFLSKQEKALEEKEILCMFHQMVAALKYIHEHNILHRDLKTANIFLTKEGVIKVGDFGISKLMTTSGQAANTVLGTPYYISPEMCEGKPYNDKSDIWALGCILYEMACLQKTFEGSNLPALVNKIMKGQYAPVKGSFSQEFKQLIMDLLQREPEYRPTSSDLWHDIVPKLMSKFEDPTSDYEDELQTSGGSTTLTKKKTRSVLYYFEMSTMQLTPVQLDFRMKIRDVAVGKDHVIVVTHEGVVYTWGEGSKGQLGHGNLESLLKPKPVEALKGKGIVRACCGDEFSVFASDNGIVMTCGDGTSGCLGHGDWCSTSRPRLIEALLSVDVISVSCGPQHVVAVGSEGEVFSWGKGADGRLGLGTEEDHCQPMEVKFEEAVCVRECRCGLDGTMLLTEVGSVWACGNNEFNKLGLNQRQGFLMAMKNIFNKIEVQGEKEFTCVRSLTKHRVIDISLGPTHSAVLVESGHVLTLGKNTEGQLGNGNTKPQNAPVEVKFFEEKQALRVKCGEYYTVASDVCNELLFWGTRFKHPPLLSDSWGSSNSLKGRGQAAKSGSKTSHSRHASTASISSASSLKDATNGSDVFSNNSNGFGGVDDKQDDTPRPRTARQTSVESQGGASSAVLAATDKNNSSFGSYGSGFKPLSSTPKRTPSASSKEIKEKDKEKDKERSKDKDKDKNKDKDRDNSRDKEKEKESPSDACELILQPTPLLRMDSSGTRNQAGDTVTLSKFFCHGENLFIQVETTAPPPKRRSKRTKKLRKRLSNQQSKEVTSSGMRRSASSREGGDEYSSEASEMDTRGSIPAWLQEELADSAQDSVDPGNEPDDTSGQSEDEVTSPMLEASITSIQINKNLSREVKQRSDKKNSASHSPKREQIKKPPANGRKDDDVRKRSSAESGIEFTPIEPISSSSSSEVTLQHPTRLGEDILGRPSSGVQRPLPGAAPAKRLSTPLPYKSKSGPAQSQKPLIRIRAQGKTRRSDESLLKGGEDIKTQQDSIEKLQIELEGMREEKQRTEERLKKMEAAHRKQQESIRMETQAKTSERELELKQEVNNLRLELKQQSAKMQENYDIVLSLQEQLLRVQTEQMRMSAREQERPQSSQSISKICSLQ